MRALDMSVRLDALVADDGVPLPEERLPLAVSVRESRTRTHKTRPECTSRAVLSGHTMHALTADRSGKGRAHSWALGLQDATPSVGSAEWGKYATQIERLAEAWCIKLENLLSTASRFRLETDTIMLAAEVEHWKFLQVKHLVGSHLYAGHLVGSRLYALEVPTGRTNGQRDE